MFPRTILALVVTTLTCGVSFATGVPGSDAGTPETILEISAVGITVDAGKDVQESYVLTDRTTATLSGLPVNPADLRPGMVASIVLADDAKTVVALHALPAPRVTKKPNPPSSVVWWIK
jgi:protein-disulfide isomerase